MNKEQRKHTRERQYKNENAVKKHVKEILEKAGWVHWVNSAGPYSTGGVSDRCALFAGHFIAIECKSGTGKATALQNQFLEKIREGGGHGWVVSPDNITHFEAWVEGMTQLWKNDRVLAK